MKELDKPSRNFVLEAQIAAMAKETPQRTSGTIYFSRDFVTEENMGRYRQRQLDKYGYVSDYALKDLKARAWEGSEDTYVSSVFREIENDSDFPQDIVLVVHLQEYGHYSDVYSSIQALVTESGLTAHGMVLTREYFKSLEDELENVVVLSNVDIAQLQSGDRVVIDLEDEGGARINVSSPSVTGKGSPQGVKDRLVKILKSFR